MLKKLLAVLTAALLFVLFVGCTPQTEPPVLGGDPIEDPDKDHGGEQGGEDKDHGGEQDGEDKDPEITVTNETYGSFWMRPHDYKTMPVGAFNALPNMRSDFTYSYIEHESTYAAYAEAGVNTMMGLYENAGTDEVLQALDWCAQYGLAYLLPLSGADSFVSATIPKSILSKVKYKSAFAGVMQCDEPGRIQFEKIVKSASVLDSIMPSTVEGALWHVNLFPTYATKKQLYFRIPQNQTLPEGGYSYARYLADYMEICKPKVLSYDYYPCATGTSLSTGYFENMALIRAEALKANIPFWVYIQTCSFSKNTRIPTLADILWQVNTALAYGAKGIQYFTGVVPSNGDGTGEQFTGAMFDRDGNRTDVYNSVKAAGTQISAVDEVLMCCKSRGLILSGSFVWEGETGIPETDLLTSYGALTSVEAGHAITGCFDYNGKPAYYVVNNSVVEEDEVRLSLPSEQSGYCVAAGVKTQFSGELTLSLSAGEGVLVVLD